MVYYFIVDLINDMRVFIAIPLPEELKSELAQVATVISQFGRMKSVEPENMHMTLKFLGEVPDNRVDEVAEALQFVNETKKFEISLKGIGVFPKPEYVRVIWVGVTEGRGKVCELQKRVDETLKPLGHKKEKKFHPHYTLARVRFVSDKKALGEYLKAREADDFGSYTVEKIILMQSTLTPSGPAYKPLKEYMPA